MTNLYHRNIFWKKEFDKASADLIKSVNHLSRHLIEYLDDNADRRNFDLEGINKVIKTLKTFDTVKSFEVETENGKLTKCVVRFKYNNQKDICIVFRYGVVITAWLCNRDDNHKTLDRSKYTRR